MNLQDFAAKLKSDDTFRQQIATAAQSGTLTPELECHLLDLALGPSPLPAKQDLLFAAVARLGLGDPREVGHISRTELTALAWLLRCKLEKRLTLGDEATTRKRYARLITALDTCFDGELLV